MIAHFEDPLQKVGPSVDEEVQKPSNEIKKRLDHPEAGIDESDVRRIFQ